MPTTPLNETRRARIGDEGVGPGVSVVAAGPGYEGYVVIDTIVDDRSAGGVRITEDLPLDEVRELAHEMSLKYALFHLPRGGAKAGVRMSKGLDTAQRLSALRDFGSKLAPLIRHGIYSPGMDMNCGPDELRAIYRGAGIELGKITDTSWFTAISVFHSLRACASALGIHDRPVSLAIEGFGSVARHLAERLDPAEFRVAAVATIEGAVRGHEAYEPARLVQAKDEEGDSFVKSLPGEVIDRDTLFTSDVDILLPSSRTWVITPPLAREMRARGVVPIANAPYGEGTIEILRDKSVICLPGYLSNVGGVLASSLFDQGVSRIDVEAFFASEYRTVVDGILRVASRSGRPVTEAASALATAHMPKRRQRRIRSLPHRVYNRFVRRRLPSAVRARLAHRTFVENLRSLQDEIVELERHA